MVDDPLHEVEDAEAHEDRPGQQLGRPAHVPEMGVSPQYEQPGRHEDVRAGMEEPVEERVDLEVADAVGGIAGARHHVVPLKDLVQHDAVEEPAQAQAEEDARRGGKVPLLLSRHGGARCKAHAEPKAVTIGA